MIANKSDAYILGYEDATRNKRSTEEHIEQKYRQSYKSGYELAVIHKIESEKITEEEK